MQKLTGLNEIAKDLDGQPVGERDENGMVKETISAGRLIANVLMGSQQSDVARAHRIAIEIHKAISVGEIELEDADYAMAKQAVEGCQLPVITKYVALQAFQELTEEDLTE